jgi:hypothetical protein
MKKRITKNRKNKTQRRRRKQSRHKNKVGKGGKYICSICEHKINDTNFMIPRECLVKYGAIRAHKICQDCWWGEFAKEGVSHRCPGCEKGMQIEPDIHKGVVIDLIDK